MNRDTSIVGYLRFAYVPELLSSSRLMHLGYIDMKYRLLTHPTDLSVGDQVYG